MARALLGDKLEKYGISAADLAALDAADLAELEALFATAQHAQRVRLQAAVEQSLEYVPRLLRSRILKMLK